MFRIARSRFVPVLAWSLVLSPVAWADVRLPHVIGDNMVLQRGKPVVIWGWADAGEKVTVTLKDRKAEATADAKGAWRVKLEAMPAGGPHELTVAGRNTITVKNVLVGEVWICSGQSNMAWPVSKAVNGAQEVAAADFPQIRFLSVPQKLAAEPQPDADIKWSVCSPQTVGSFSAAGFFFGRHLHKELNVPIGLINSSWGGTAIEPWTPPAGFEAVPKLNDIAEDIRKAEGDRWQKLRQHSKAVAEKPKKKQPAVTPTATQRAAEAAAARALRLPTSMYNAMIHPLVPFAIRGAIWYQGEQNVMTGDLMYYEKMQALIGGWRAVWAQGDFPFYYVQLAPFNYMGREPKPLGENSLPKLWDTQLASLSIPNTGMAVVTDIATLKDIHPTNKQEVGRRLALWAMVKTYGKKDLVCSGPLYKSMKIENGGIRIQFDSVGGGLAARDDKPLSWFQIAGEDRNFVEAQAKIDGSSVIVSSDKVAKPVAVRFGWDEQAQPNLVNKEGLPASPFRTDAW